MDNQQPTPIPGWRPGPKHPGYKPTCTVCGVSAQISETVILKRLAEGLERQGLEVVSVAGREHGTPIGLITPLISLLREKGIRVI